LAAGVDVAGVLVFAGVEDFAGALGFWSWSPKRSNRTMKSAKIPTHLIVLR